MLFHKVIIQYVWFVVCYDWNENYWTNVFCSETINSQQYAIILSLFVL